MAWKAFTGTGQPFYGYKVLIEIARQPSEPYLATITFKEPAMEAEANKQNDGMPPRGKRVKTSHDQAEWRVRRPASVELKSKEQEAPVNDLLYSTRSAIAMDLVDGINPPPQTPDKLVTYHIGNLQGGVSAGHLKTFLEKHKM